MLDIWERLDGYFSQPFKFEKDIMKYTLPVMTLQDNDQEGIAVYYHRLQSLVKESERANMERQVISPSNIDLLTQKLSEFERRQWGEYIHYYGNTWSKEILFKNFVVHRTNYAQAQQLVAGEAETRSFRADNREQRDKNSGQGKPNHRRVGKASVHAVEASGWPPAVHTVKPRTGENSRFWHYNCILGEKQCNKRHHPVDCEI